MWAIEKKFNFILMELRQTLCLCQDSTEEFPFPLNIFLFHRSFLRKPPLWLNVEVTKIRTFQKVPFNTVLCKKYRVLFYKLQSIFLDSSINILLISMYKYKTSICQLYMIYSYVSHIYLVNLNVNIYKFDRVLLNEPVL